MPCFGIERHPYCAFQAQRQGGDRWVWRMAGQALGRPVYPVSRCSVLHVGILSAYGSPVPQCRGPNRIAMDFFANEDGCLEFAFDICTIPPCRPPSSSSCRTAGQTPGTNGVSCRWQCCSTKLEGTKEPIFDLCFTAASLPSFPRDPAAKDLESCQAGTPVVVSLVPLNTSTERGSETCCFRCRLFQSQASSPSTFQRPGQMGDEQCSVSMHTSAGAQ